MSLENENKLDELVMSQAMKKGLSAKDAKKALKKLKAGGMMAQVAPHLQSQFMEMNPNMSLRDKLRAKTRKMQEARSNKQSKESSYEKTRQSVYNRQEQEKQDKEQKKKKETQRKKNHRKKIKELGKKLGEIKVEHYNECLLRVNENQYKDSSELNRDKNIIELYGIQQSFKDTIAMDDLDDI